jgi:hypothetical protein
VKDSEEHGNSAASPVQSGLEVRTRSIDRFPVSVARSMVQVISQGSEISITSPSLGEVTCNPDKKWQEVINQKPKKQGKKINDNNHNNNIHYVCTITYIICMQNIQAPKRSERSKDGVSPDTKPMRLAIIIIKTWVIREHDIP